MVDLIIVGLEWEINNNKWVRFSNRDGCIYDGVGVLLFIFLNKNGGLWSLVEKKFYINVLELKVVNIVVKLVIKNK